MYVPRPLTPNETGLHARPKLLLADDHAVVLETVAALLAEDFDIVATASDGLQALDLSLRLDPDLDVLDVTMPELDGFQTLRELRRLGSRAKVVLLTAHKSDEFVANAIRSGAQGYVLKMKIPWDLTSAIDHALAGRLFVPSLTSLSAVTAGAHTVQLHTNDRVFLDEVSEFIALTLQSGEPIVVAATEQTRTKIAQRLKKRWGMALDAMEAQKQYVVLDAAKSLSQFMRNGRPDADRLAEIVADLDRLRVSSAGPQSRLTIWGEMAVLLCREGNVQAAVEVEQIWSDLTRQLSFLTVCSYPIKCFFDEGALKLFPNMCAEHSAVSHALGW